MDDDVDEETKSKRLTEIIDEQQRISYEVNQDLISTEDIILIEGFSKKSNQYFAGRTDTNKVVIIPVEQNIAKSDYVKVRINKASSGTLFGDVIEKIDVTKDFEQKTA